MTLQTLSLYQFRNYAEEKVRLAPGLTLLIGDNAQGKTNLLEAVFYFGAGKSHREARDVNLIRHGSPDARIGAHITAQGREQTLAVAFSRTARKSIWINDVKCASPRELTGRLPCVLFGPEELALIGGGAAPRRRFMNLALCQLSPRYLSQLAEYKRLHEHKNKLLRAGRPDGAMARVLPDFNRRLSETGAALICERAAFIDEIAALAADVQRDMGGETLSLLYRTVSRVNPRGTRDEIREQLYDRMEEGGTAEWAAGTSLYGPHRDTVEIRLSGVSLSHFGSQGQRRTAALALKLAERALFCRAFGEPPLLLLDDALSELDAHRRTYVLERLWDGQILIAGCDPDESYPKDARRMYVKNGRISE